MLNDFIAVGFLATLGLGGDHASEVDVFCSSSDTGSSSIRRGVLYCQGVDARCIVMTFGKKLVPSNAVTFRKASGLPCASFKLRLPRNPNRTWDVGCTFADLADLLLIDEDAPRNDEDLEGNTSDIIDIAKNLLNVKFRRARLLAPRLKTPEGERR